MSTDFNAPGTRRSTRLASQHTSQNDDLSDSDNTPEVCIDGDDEEEDFQPGSEASDEDEYFDEVVPTQNKSNKSRKRANVPPVDSSDVDAVATSGLVKRTKPKELNAKVDQVPVTDDLRLLCEAVDNPAKCKCIELNLYQAGPLKAMARSLYSLYQNINAPSNKNAAIALLCPLHFQDESSVSELLKSLKCDVNHQTLVWKEFVDEAPDSVNDLPNVGWSVMYAYMVYFEFVLLPSLGIEMRNLLLPFVPHLLRDLAVNHYWHITLGHVRVGAYGTVTNAVAIAQNFFGMDGIMSTCYEHYELGSLHRFCGITRKKGNKICRATLTLNTLDDTEMEVLQIIQDCRVVVSSTFVYPRRVTNIHEVYPFQADLQQHFKTLYVRPQ